MNPLRLYLTANLVPFALFAYPACALAGDGFMNPAGAVAQTERQMFFEIATVTAIVVVPVFLLLPWIVWRYRRSAGRGHYSPDWDRSRILEWLVWGIPVLIVAGLAYFTWVRTQQLDPYTRLSGDPQKPLVVQVVALDWKWLFIYPERGIASVNELAIPAGRPVKLYLTSATVMQSFHVPRLSGQIYAMAGMTTQMSLVANRSGTFTGRNTQYNGDGFARQHFVVRAVAETEFEAWLGTAARTPKRLDTASFSQLAKPGTIAAAQYYGSVEPHVFTAVLAMSVGATNADTTRPSPMQPMQHSGARP